jgi:outer membrane protein assembly factor BamA
MKKLLAILLMLGSVVAFAQQQDSCFVVSKINVTGNKVTKLSTIDREMLFKVGDTICSKDIIKQSRENLQNTTLFNFVDFYWTDDETLKKDSKSLTINVTERWYLWPVPYLAYADRNLTAWFKEGDFSRLSYGFDLIYKNLWGLKHELDLTVIAGYNQNLSLSYDIPYLTHRQRLGVKASGGYLRDREVPYITDNDKIKYFKGNDEYAHESFFAYLMPYYRFGYRNKLSLLFRYDDRTFNDSLPELNPDFGNPEGTRFQYFTLSAVFKNDYRDDHNYPLDGHYLEVELTKIGFGHYEYTPDLFYGKLTADWYTPIKGRFYWASNLTMKISDSNSAPYFLSQGFGYKNDYVRTYDLYVVDALKYGIIKNNLKFAILKPMTTHLPLIKNDRFGKIHIALYANLFFDMGYTWDVVVPEGFTTRIANKFIYGTGFGIDFVTYYDKVLRLEYGVNGLGEAGFFVHLVAPI